MGHGWVPSCEKLLFVFRSNGIVYAATEPLIEISPSTAPESSLTVASPANETLIGTGSLAGRVRVIVCFASSALMGHLTWLKGIVTFFLTIGMVNVQSTPQI